MEDSTFMVLVLILFILLYVIIPLSYKASIQEQIKNFSGRKKQIFSSTADIFLTMHNGYIEVISWLLFPMYISFALGAYFGGKIYNTLIENKDENRIASWLF